VREAATDAGWRGLLAPRLVLTLSVLLGGVLLHSMNVLITATLLPSIVAELGGADLMSWPTTAFVASSIIAASGTSLVSGRFGNRRAFSGGAVIYAAGAVLCACAPSINFVIAGRFVQGLGGGLLSALAYVLVRNAFPEPLWPKVFGLLAGVWSVTVLIGPLIGGVFASYGHWRSAFVTVAGLGCLLGAGSLFHASSRQSQRPGCQPDFSGGPRCVDLWRDRALVGGECCDRPRDQGHAHRGNHCGVRPDDADRSARRCPAPAKRCVLATVGDWCGALDDTAHVCRIQPAGDIRATLFAALARGQSAGRRVHGRVGVVGVDDSRALGGLALRGMASAIDHYGPVGDGRGSRWSGGIDGARTGRGPDPANRIDRSWDRRRMGVCSAARHERREVRRGEHRCRLRRDGSAGGDCPGCGDRRVDCQCERARQWSRPGFGVARVALGSFGAGRGTPGRLCDWRAIEPDGAALSRARTNRR